MSIFIYMAVMAGVTYLIRMIPFTLFRQKIQSPFFRSLLHYIPYAVLSAMTIPAIFTSTGSLPTSLAGRFGGCLSGRLGFLNKKDPTGFGGISVFIRL